MESTGNNKRNFIFLAHWVEAWNWLLWWSADLHENPHHALRWVWLWPLYIAVSIFYLIGRKAFDVVDRYEYQGLAGETVLLRNFAYHFLMGSWRRKIRQRILTAVLSAQENGAQVIGLGALTKAEWLTAGGKWIVDTLGTKLKVPIVHGDTLTAAAVLYRVIDLLRGQSLPEYGPVFLTGGTSKIGRAVALSLAKRGVTVFVYTQSRERFDELKAEAESLGCGQHLRYANAMALGKRCPLWITGKAEPGIGKKIIANLPQEATVVNFSVPDPLTPSLLSRRQDVFHVDGGLMGYHTQLCSQQFTMRLKPGLLYACHAGTIVHANKGWQHHEVGQVDLGEIEVIWLAATQELGMFLPPLTSHLRSVQLTSGNFRRALGAPPMGTVVAGVSDPITTSPSPRRPAAGDQKSQTIHR